MPQTFIGQILEKYSNVRTLEFMTDINLMKWPQGLKALCKSFRKIVSQLPSTVAIFFLLNLSSRQESQTIEDFSSAIIQILKAQKKSAAIMKVFISSPETETYMRRLERERIEVTDIIHVQEHLDATRQCFDALRWALNAGQTLEEVLLQMSVNRRKRVK